MTKIVLGDDWPEWELQAPCLLRNGSLVGTYVVLPWPFSEEDYIQLEIAAALQESDRQAMAMSTIKDKVLSFFKAHWGEWLWGVVVFLLGAKTGLLWGDFITTTIGLGPDDYNGLAGGTAYLLAAEPCAAMRSSAGVGITPPNVPGAPKLASSVTMSNTLGAPFGGTTRGGHQAFNSEALSLITPPNFGSGGGSCFPVIVVVAPDCATCAILD